MKPTDWHGDIDLTHEECVEAELCATQIAGASDHDITAMHPEEAFTTGIALGLKLARLCDGTQTVPAH